jgi:prophage DNA circulation protein
MRLTPFQLTLQTASFRGVPFYTSGVDLRAGRRNAPHQYPFRDTVYAEDLGRAMRTYHVSAFLVGDDLNFQHQNLLAACEADGEGILVTPSTGSIAVICAQFDAQQTTETNRQLIVRLTFVEAGSLSSTPVALPDFAASLINAAVASISLLQSQYHNDLVSVPLATTATIAAAIPAPSTDPATNAINQQADNSLPPFEGV